MTGSAGRRAGRGARHPPSRARLGPVGRWPSSTGCRPAVVLIEGPADADPLLALAADPGMVPPVALLAYAPDGPAGLRVLAVRGVLPGMAGAAPGPPRNGVPVRFCDLPAAMVLAAESAREASAGDTGDADGAGDERRADGAADGGEVTQGRPGQRRPGGRDQVRDDPIGLLAAAAGYDDPERWWEDVIEARPERDQQPPFRRARPRPWPNCGPRRRGGSAPSERREAHMRQVLRAR